MKQPLPYNMYLQLKEIFLILDNGDRLVLQKFGLSVGRFNLLSHLAKHDELSPKELSKLMLCDKANTTRLLAGVEKDGLIQRRQDDTDGRGQCIRLRRAGKDLWEKAHAELVACNAERFRIFNATEQQGLTETLDRLKVYLREHLDQM